MREIDITNWNRKEHFNFFKRTDLPFYNVNNNVEITRLREFAKENSLSLNNVLMFLTIRTMNQIENFRYRLRGEKVILHTSLSVSFAHIRKGEDLFRMITVDFIDNLAQFDFQAKEAVSASNDFFDLSKLAERDDFVFISALPWFSFTGIDHTLSLNKADSIPRVSWGKFFETEGRLLLPYNIRVNHMFVDGIHIGLFFKELDKQISLIRYNA
jgi:chloramphenicol O-acetyltransferase type A